VLLILLLLLLLLLQDGVVVVVVVAKDGVVVIVVDSDVDMDKEELLMAISAVDWAAAARSDATDVDVDDVVVVLGKGGSWAMVRDTRRIPAMVELTSTIHLTIR
jgi:hypothetical protein